LAFENFEEVVEIGVDMKGEVKNPAHGGSKGFGVEGVGALGVQKDGFNRECCSASDESTEISGFGDFIEDEDAIPFSIGRFIRFSVVSDGDEFLGAGVFGEEVDSSFFEGVGRPRKRGRKFLARGVGFGEKAFYGPAGFEEFLEEASTFDEKELIFVAIFFLFEGAIALKLGGGEFFHKKINQKINF
jgi:hypothetical protein